MKHLAGNALLNHGSPRNGELAFTAHGGRTFAAQASLSAADIWKMTRRWIIVLFLALLTACGRSPGRMEHPEDPQGRYREQIEVARRLLEQEEQWADRAEWEVAASGNGWKVTAWRVEHPEATGPNRYLPWGYSVIELDSRMVAVAYHRKG